MSSEGSSTISSESPHSSGGLTATSAGGAAGGAAAAAASGSGPTVLVAGGGVSGLLTAVALAHIGADVHIYEQNDAASFASPEAGVLLTDDLKAFLAAHKVPLDRKRCVRTAGRQVLSPKDGDVHVQDARAQEYVSLAGLYSALLAAFPHSHYHARARVGGVDLSDPDYAVLELESGERIAGHVVVAADGAGSALRRQLLPACAAPRYAGYLAWRGVAQLEALSPEVAELLAGKASILKAANTHVQVHPVPNARGADHPLAWTWFNNQPEEELGDLMVDARDAPRAYSVPLGQLSPAVADAVAAAAKTALPAPLAEVVGASARCMSVTAVSDLAMPLHALNNRVAFVGQAGSVVRPHGISATQKALRDAISLAVALRGVKRAALEAALGHWSDVHTRECVELVKSAAVSGDRLQGTAEA